MQYHSARSALYFALMLFSIVMIGLCAARIHYTTHLPATDPFAQLVNYFDNIVVELLVAACLTFLWSIYAIMAIHRRLESGIISKFAGELVGLFILFVLWLVGAALASKRWGNLSFCWGFTICRVLTTLLAFAWIGWITILILMIITIFFAHRNKSYNGHMHGRYGPDYEEGRLPTRQV